MAKVQSFGDKVAKAQASRQTECPVCGSQVSYVKVIAPTQTDSGSYSFRPRMEKSCKCNSGDNKGN